MRRSKLWAPQAYFELCYFYLNFVQIQSSTSLMTRNHFTKLNPSTWLLITLGACSADATIKDIIGPNPTGTYRYTCDSGADSVGIQDRGGALSVYKNNQVLYTDHPGGNLSLFLTTQEPNVTEPFLRGFALENQTESDLEFYSLSLEVNVESGDLKVGEEKFIRSTPQDAWTLSSSQEVLTATNCRTP